MLCKFEVSNFKNFGEPFALDLSSTKSYEFNPECVQNGIVANSIIYGPNACGKTNLGYAVFDIRTHLTDEKIGANYETNYLNAATGEEPAEFAYVFRFGDDEVEYSYRKASVRKLLSEVLKINGKTVISLDRRKGSVAEFNLKGTETLNRDLGSGLSDENSPLSAVKYVASSTVLASTPENTIFRKFVTFVRRMQHFTTDTAQYVKATPGDIADIILRFDDDLTTFESFLRDAGVDCELRIIEVSGEKRVAFAIGDSHIDFAASASTGTLSLTSQYIQLLMVRLYDQISDAVRPTVGDDAARSQAEEKGWLPGIRPFCFVDEFDAFYHHAAARYMVETLKNLNCQSILTTHNTSIMSNDLLRPDCYFIMSAANIRPAYAFTDKELRKAHNIEKMYRAGVFDG